MDLKKYKHNFYLLLASILIISSCDKMEDGYMEFAKGGEIIYLGKADSLKTFSGRDRIKVSWLLISDPKITRSVIYWNDKRDSSVVNIQRSSGVDTISVFLENMAEQSYNFEVYNYDNAGNFSVKTEVIGTVYGERYAATLTNRSLESSIYDAEDKSVEIKWFGAATQAEVMDIRYTDVNGVERVIKEFKVANINNPRLPKALPSSTVLPDYKKETTLSYRTGYLPRAGAIDTFYTDFKTVELEFPEEAEAINLALGATVDKSSDISAGRAINIVDNNRETYWQTGSSDRSDLNTWVSLDLGTAKPFNEIGLYWNGGFGLINVYEILYSNDNATWQTAFTKNSPVPQEEVVQFTAVTARYIKLNITLVGSTSNVTLKDMEVYNK